MSKFDLAAEREAAFHKRFIDALTVDEIRTLADKHGYTLRSKGQKREKRQVLDADGNPVKNAYMPHLAISATCYARTWKMLENAKKAFGYEATDKTSNNGEVWEAKLLLACEHIVRWLSHDIDDAEMHRQIQRLVNPLPKSEYLSNKNNKKNKENT